MHSIVIVHPTSLVGKELRERLEARPDLCRELRLVSADEEEVGKLTESAGGAAFVGRLDLDSFAGADLVFFCGGIESDRQALALLPERVPAIVLSRGAGEGDGVAAVAGVRPDAILGLDRLVSPHPAAVALALLLDPLAGLDPRRAEATVLASVSTAEDGALDELFEQTRGILAFAGHPKHRIFPTQIAFNLLPAPDDPGEVAKAARRILAADYPLSVQIVQAGVFHGLALSLYLEVDPKATVAEVRRRLVRSPAASSFRDPRKLGPVAAAGEESLLIGDVRAAETPGGFWIWAVMDNLLRGGALNAVALAERLLAAGPAS